MLPNIADVRDIGSLELGLALGVSGVVGGSCFEVGRTHWSGLGTVFRYRGPQGGKHRVQPPAVRTKGARQVVKTMSAS